MADTDRSRELDQYSPANSSISGSDLPIPYQDIKTTPGALDTTIELQVDPNKTPIGEDQEEQKWRICFDDTPKLEKFCSCSGSIGLFHKECLEAWLNTRDDPKCEICGDEYNVVVDITKEFSCKFCANIPRRNHIQTVVMMTIVTFCAAYFIGLCFEQAMGGDIFCIVAILIFIIVFLLTLIRVLRGYRSLLTVTHRATTLAALERVEPSEDSQLKND